MPAAATTVTTTVSPAPVTTPKSTRAVPAPSALPAEQASGLPSFLERWHAVPTTIAISVLAKLAVVLAAWGMLGTPDWFWAKLATAWDGTHYLTIAREGYQFRLAGDGGSVHWAPLYPILVRAFGGAELSAILVSNLASFGAIALVAWHFGRRAGIFLALFPSWLVFGTVAYSESVFVLAAAVALVGLERRWFTGAGLGGALAVATRFMGGPALMAASLPYGRWKEWRAYTTPLLIGLAGAAAWGYLWYNTGHFDGYFVAQKPWGGELAWPWERIHWLLTGWFTTQFGTIQQGNLGPIDFVVRDVLFTAPFVLGLAMLWRRPDARGTWAYCLVVLATALCVSGTPAAALPRYLLAGFPAIAILGDRLRTPGTWAAYAAVALALGAHGLVRHVAGYWS